VYRVKFFLCPIWHINVISPVGKFYFGDFEYLPDIDVLCVFSCRSELFGLFAGVEDICNDEFCAV
tara:strand:- start:211 stop:405 length:195 start_codon:yes stop_codon:yes gene_type:complete